MWALKKSPIENTLQPLCGAAFRATHSFAFARCSIQPFSSIGLFISSAFLYLDTTCRCYALTVPAIRCQHTVKSCQGGPESLVRGLSTNAASFAIHMVLQEKSTLMKCADVFYDLISAIHGALVIAVHRWCAGN